MAYIKKTWVNKEDIPESELGQHPRFDADNMNRIEAGIEEAHNSVGEHTHTKEDVGLGNVPNVATNNQTPTYTSKSTIEELSSGETLSVAFGKIKKAITDLISHLKNSTIHITSTERTTWNGKANASHTHDDRYYTETEVNTLLNGRANASHTHDDRYYTETEVNTLLNGKAPSYSSGTTDIGAGSALATGKLHFVYEAE